MQPCDTHHLLERYQPLVTVRLRDLVDLHFLCHVGLKQILAHLIPDSKAHSHLLHPLRYQSYFQLKLLSFHFCEVDQLKIDPHPMLLLEHQLQT